MGLSYREVAEILKIIDSSQCDELVLELEGVRLVVRRGTAGGGTAQAPAPPPAATGDAAARLEAPAAAPAPASAPATSATGGAAPAEVAAATAATAPAGTPAGAADGVTVRAPMVGTFYRRPSPEEDPFVEVGARVEKGTALGLIEVMKLYTTIESQSDGVVEAIVADDGALVEFNQPLFVIRPA